MLVKRNYRPFRCCLFRNQSKKGMERRFTMAVSTVDLPKSGKILVADFYERHSKQLKARFFSDAKNFTCCMEWPVQRWTERNPRKVLGDWNADCADGDTETCATFFGTRRSYYCSEALGIIDGFCCDVQAEYRNRREAARLLLQKNTSLCSPRSRRICVSIAKSTSSTTAISSSLLKISAASGTDFAAAAASISAWSRASGPAVWHSAPSAASRSDIVQLGSRAISWTVISSASLRMWTVSCLSAG